jgi:hypothetical protein
MHSLFGITFVLNMPSRPYIAAYIIEQVSRLAHPRSHGRHCSVSREALGPRISVTRFGKLIYFW